jgi:hypothetical protein
MAAAACTATVLFAAAAATVGGIKHRTEVEPDTAATAEHPHLGRTRTRSAAQIHPHSTIASSDLSGC